MSDNLRKNIAAAVLAAGKGSRFGATKQLAKFRNESLIQISAQHALDVLPHSTVVVLGHARHEIVADLKERDVFLVCNEHFEEGIGSSIATAARVCANRFDALLLTFCDQPLVTADHLRTLLETWSGAPDEIIASGYAGVTGPPTLFGRDAIQELTTLRGDEGARALLRDSRFNVISVPYAAAAKDVDTPADLEQL